MLLVQRTVKKPADTRSIGTQELSPVREHKQANTFQCRCVAKRNRRKPAC